MRKSFITKITDYPNGGKLNRCIMRFDPKDKTYAEGELILGIKRKNAEVCYQD
jgi:hypothetical protein